MFSPNASGVGEINELPAFAPTPLTLGLNVKNQSQLLKPTAFISLSVSR